jgi:hypothetical protein
LTKIMPRVPMRSKNDLMSPKSLKRSSISFVWASYWHEEGQKRARASFRCLTDRLQATSARSLTRSHVLADGQWDGHAIGNSQRYCG